MMLRIGLLGAGTVTRQHDDAIEAATGVKLAAVFDPDGARREVLATRHAARLARVDALIRSERCSSLPWPRATLWQRDCRCRVWVPTEPVPTSPNRVGVSL